ncbi:hypothetical protein NEOLEDRAFT_1173799 [Neolentinus lepideus HHB14362 ss-1]|uniref:DUF6697 domain-containing protein n=1 Tax=Neolentinus lepideus HHB14362 ss-1 TaxID=1314782 RepID=A0A165VXV4_9AGAM|nr:hypothetical protein NEOLEDRAFT_1173799 [Neolentinus lepideus HHB14362 ss-1]
MDVAIDDAQLAQQMLRLLGEDLIRVRRELSESRAQLDCRGRSSSADDFQKESLHLREELEVAKGEIDVLRARIQELSSAPHHGDADSLVTPVRDSLQREIDALTTEVAHMKAIEQRHKSFVQTEKIATLKEKIAALRTKCKRNKAARQELQMRLDEALADESPSQNTSQGDSFPEDFLADQSYSLSDPLPDPLQHVFYGAQFQYKKIQFLHLNSREVCWGSKDNTHGVALAPLHQYNPRKGVENWEQYGLSRYQQGGRYELLYMKDHQWSYIGTYEIIETRILPFEKVQGFKPEVQEYLVNRTVTDRTLAPPFLYAMMRNMYAAGALRIECMAIRRVGFNVDLYDDLLRRRDGQRSSLDMPPVSIPIPGQDHRNGGKRQFNRIDSDGQPLQDDARAKKIKFS